MSEEPVAVKLVVVGDGSVGKTCLLIRYKFDNLATHKTSFLPNMSQLYSTTMRLQSK
jgi:GTPase SAR1 family protein